MDEGILKHIATKHDLEDLRIEFRQSQDAVLSRLDEIITTVRRIDQERVFTFEYIKRLETRLGETEAEVEQNRKDINRIKDILKIG
ncbi:MAG: hypothetical protein K6T91_07305 [Firmicutes bacterium]|nr:hypothetical protein [Bacillota bacterium]